MFNSFLFWSYKVDLIKDNVNVPGDCLNLSPCPLFEWLYNSGIKKRSNANRQRQMYSNNTPGPPTLICPSSVYVFNFPLLSPSPPPTGLNVFRVKWSQCDCSSYRKYKLVGVSLVPLCLVISLDTCFWVLSSPAVLRNTHPAPSVPGQSSIYLSVYPSVCLSLMSVISAPMKQSVVW